MDKKYTNVEQMAQFVRDVNDELLYKNGKIKEPYKHIATSVDAFRQFMIEVKGYGLGMSSMTADEWFNSDYGARQVHAAQIASVFEAYQKAEAEEVTEADNPILVELAALKNKIAEMEKAMADMSGMEKDEAKAEGKDGAMGGGMGGGGMESEKPAETPEPVTETETETEPAESETEAEPGEES